MPKVLLILLLSAITYSCCLSKRIDNICSTQHIKRVFLRLGESGVLTAHNITHDVFGNVSLHEGCQVEIVTCPSCIVSLTFRLMNLKCYCGSGFNLFFHNPCRCDYVWITEPPYGSVSGVSFCKILPNTGNHRRGLTYKSQTRIIRVSLFYSRPHNHAFTADYKSEENRQVFFGTPHYPLELNLSTGFFSSPFFPVAYPRDLIAEYVLICLRQTNISSQEFYSSVENDSNCRIHLLFTDFQLASSSSVEFYEGNQRVKVVNGISFRPPAITSATNSLSIRFYASGRSSVGFKAVFSFISQSVLNKMAMPSTDCGGYVDDFGGTIAMMKMVPSRMKLFDCIWLIRPLSNFFSVKSHLYLKVTTFLAFGSSIISCLTRNNYSQTPLRHIISAGDAELEIRQGLTSESPLVEKLRHPVPQNFREHIIPLKSGYYVSLRASFGPESHFAVTYASFSQNKCLILSEFLCKNYRCISKKLTCDGSDHCGDSSDEPEVCLQEWNLVSRVGRWFTQRPNYYFPKIKQHLGLKRASLVFVVGLVGLFLFILALTMVLYRIRSTTQQRRVFHDQVQSTRDLRDTISDEVSMEDVLIDDPPSYEPPPNYEEVVKIFSRPAPCNDYKQYSTEFC